MFNSEAQYIWISSWVEEDIGPSPIISGIQHYGAGFTHGHIFCGSNCIVMNFMGNECDIAPYTDAYETIKSVPIVQAATAYDNPETGDTTILILKEAIWMGETMKHTLVNPNQMRVYGMTAQDNPFSEVPIFIATEDHDFMIPLSSKGTILVVTTINPTDKELQTCPHFTYLLAHEWYPYNVCIPKIACIV